MSTTFSLPNNHYFAPSEADISYLMLANPGHVQVFVLGCLCSSWCLIADFLCLYFCKIVGVGTYSSMLPVLLPSWHCRKRWSKIQHRFGKTVLPCHDTERIFVPMDWESDGVM